MDVERVSATVVWWVYTHTRLVLSGNLATGKRPTHPPRSVIFIELICQVLGFVVQAVVLKHGLERPATI